MSFVNRLLALLGLWKPLPTPQPAPDLSVTQSVLIDAHNRLRTAHGLLPLSVSPLLMNAAQSYAEVMAQAQRLNHTGPDGSTFSYRIAHAGFHGTWMGENIAMGQRTVDAVMQSWTNSPGHFANMTSKDARFIGVGMAVSKGGNPYWCVDFGG